MKYLLVISIFVITLSSCRDKIICPAFQSTYILDDSVRATYYSYLWKIDKEERQKYLDRQRPVDTTITSALASAKKVDYYSYLEKYIVPEREVEKTKYGIVKYEPYWMKTYQLRTAPKENVLTPQPLPVEKTFTEVGEFIAADFSDSLTLDSMAVAAVPMDSVEDVFVLPTLARAAPKKEKPPVKYLYNYDPKDSLLNVDQAYYNKYFGYLLVDNRKAPEPQPLNIKPERSSVSASDSSGVKSPGIRINFGKKDKQISEDPESQEDIGEISEEENDGF